VTHEAAEAKQSKAKQSKAKQRTDGEVKRLDLPRLGAEPKTPKIKLSPSGRRSCA
jgi:hypothetical protein